MKSLFRLILAFSLAVTLNAAEKIVVGASPIPHAEILEAAKPLLKEKGYELEIRVFNDYIIPNKALQDGQLDANYYQHIPYLEEFNAREKTDLVATVKVHIEPMGVYSKKIKNVSELKDGDKVAIPNDPTNESRALELLAAIKIISLNNNSLKTPKDITDNPKNLKFIEIEAAQLPRTLGDTTLSVINTNFAINAGLNPLKDALAIESGESPYSNIIAVKRGNEESAKIKALNEAMTSQTVKKFIETKYNGTIIPVF
ncbi:MetQ/NlpA family ABC transporter substrate-binding protein [uncultured Campylobacter sp.]|uniref:MetQ/NlpA family ABC transporter substrate-binding protein n=1 Tax=uncultured Campylobacter sp. TaxID=218934 RepID=UPI0026245788|nr:MetQ/NlpA family ABC transporter substrate-binding protein [uncultured Campylobacter sp.]